MKKLILCVALTLPISGNAVELDGYAAKCAELIEQAKSPTSSWTTSLEEAAMAGECIGVIKTITAVMNEYRNYSCRSGSVVSNAERIVKARANSVGDVARTLCNRY